MRWTLESHNLAMNLPPIPGLGWATPPDSKFIMHDQSVVVRAGDFPSSKPAELLKLVSTEIVDVEMFTQTIENVLATYFCKNNRLKEELSEIYATGKSNDRDMIWNLQKIAPNVSFRLHCHQNIELIYVIRGGMNEFRMASPPVKRIFPLCEKEGPDMSDPSLNVQFITRSVGAGSFLINEKGSMHMSWSSETGAELLVLWSGGHGRMPAEFYPANANEVFVVPEGVTPF